MNRSCCIAVLVAFACYPCAATPPETSAPLARYDFDETTGIRVCDLVGGIDGEIRGDVKRVPGIRGSAVRFPGDKEAYIACTDERGALNTTCALTVEAWVFPTDSGTRWDGIVCNAGDRTGYQLFYGEQEQKLALFLNTAGTGYKPVNGAHIPVDRWTHVAATYDAVKGRVELFQDGERTASAPFEGAIRGFSRELLIGRSAVATAFRGIIDEVRIYGRALDPAEIREHFIELAPKVPPAVPVPAPAFCEMSGRLTPAGIALSFATTDLFRSTPEGATSNTRVFIYRGECPKNDMNPGVKTAIPVFHGNLETTDGRHLTYTDPLTTRPGTTYCYWVSPDGKNFRVNPAKVRVYDPAIWWSPEAIENRLQAIAAAHPERIKVRRLGNTAQGRPLNALLAGNPRKRVVLVGAMHVSESGPELILPAFEGLVRDCPELLDEIGIAALPCVTLDERARLLESGIPIYLRRNANRVDLNRNFPAFWEEVGVSYGSRTDDPGAETYRGPAPASEPETQVVVSLLREANPVAVFSFHSVGSLCNAGFVFSKYAKTANDTKYTSACEETGLVYAKGMYGGEGAKVHWVEGNGSAGSLATYAFKEFGAPAFDMELDRTPGPRAVLYSDSLSQEMQREYQERHQKGIEAVLRAFAGREQGEKRGETPRGANP
jgi:hypothetical protein